MCGRPTAGEVLLQMVQELAQEYNVSAMPTIMFFKNGEKVAEVVGLDIKRLEQLLDEHLEKPNEDD